MKLNEFFAQVQGQTVESTPPFICETCGYIDYLGTELQCPVCRPKDDGDVLCFFLDMVNSVCRIDGKDCDRVINGDYIDCPKVAE